MKKDNKKDKEGILEVGEGAPVCDKCGNAMIEEAGEWFCPHCQGEIDFLGEDDE